MQNSLLHVVWTNVLAGCVHNHPIMVKIHPVLFFFLNPNKWQPLSQIKLFSDSWLCDVTQTQDPPTIVDWHWCLTLDPPWVSCQQSAIVSTPGASFITVAQAQNLPWKRRTPLPTQKVGFIKTNLAGKFPHLHANWPMRTNCFSRSEKINEVNNNLKLFSCQYTHLH